MACCTTTAPPTERAPGDEALDLIIQKLQVLKTPVFGFNPQGSVSPVNVKANEAKVRCTSPRSGLELLAMLVTEPADAPPVKEQPAPAPPVPAPLALEYAGPRDAVGRPLVGDGLVRGAPVAALRIGNRVEIHGVAHRGAQFNGMLGNVRSVLGGERFGVEVEQVGRVLSVRSQHLRFVEKGTAMEDTKAWPSAAELHQQQVKRLTNAKARGERYKQQEAQLEEWFGRWWGRDTAHVEQAAAPAPSESHGVAAAAQDTGAALAEARAPAAAAAIEYAPRWWELKDVPKAQLESTQPSLTEVFKLRPGEWQCGSCLTRNTARAVKQCASCSANKCAAASRQ